MLICYWLTPAEPQKAILADLIQRLAQQYEAPLFEPHLTVRALHAAEEPADAKAVLEQIAGEHPPLELISTGVGFSETFTRTLFIQFADNPALASMAADLEHALTSPSPYELTPHVSLIYKDLEDSEKRLLAASLDVPGVITFDTLKVIAAPDTITSGKDIEQLREVASATLGR